MSPERLAEVVEQIVRARVCSNIRTDFMALVQAVGEALNSGESVSLEVFATAVLLILDSYEHGRHFPRNDAGDSPEVLGVLN